MAEEKKILNDEVVEGVSGGGRIRRTSASPTMSGSEW